MKDFNDNIQYSQKTLGEVAKKSLDWLNTNFFKLTDTNKLRVILALVGKIMPDKVEHSGEVKSGTRITILHDQRQLQANEEADRSPREVNK